MIISKGMTFLAQTGIFNDDIREWRRKSADLKTWEKYNFFHRVHREQKRALTTALKGGSTATVQNIYSVPPLSLEEPNELIENTQTIFREFEHKDTSWKDWHNPMHSLPA